MWRRANVRLLPSAALFILGAVVSTAYGNVRHGGLGHRFMALLGVILFVIFATAFLRVLTKTIARIVASHHINVGRAAALQFGLRVFGYIAIFLTTLDLLGVPVGKLLLGGAAIGVILGIAAQQALANFFASVVLIISHPFSVGEHVTFNSGGLGGKYRGEIKDIGLTHTRLEEADGTVVLLPNATLLSGATITTQHSPAPLQP
ncbi:MAG: mechanosensitive ion channel family protein [Candidatus Saccharibacteria bacterium]